MNECSSAIFHVFGAADRFITLPDTAKSHFCFDHADQYAQRSIQQLLDVRSIVLHAAHMINIQLYSLVMP